MLLIVMFSGWWLFLGIFLGVKDVLKELTGTGEKPLPPTDDLVLQHKKQVIFQNPKLRIFNSPVIYTMCITITINDS